MAETLQDKINLKGTLEAWKNFTVKDWQKQFIKLRIGQTGQGEKILSRTYTVGSIRIVFEYYEYMDFVKWGVGKGVSIGDIKGRSMLRNALTKGRSKYTRKLMEGVYGLKRKPKNWFGKPFKYNVYRLAEIVAAKYATEVPKVIKVNLQSK